MYTKHTWNSDKHFNFKYVQYLPKDFSPEEKDPLVFFLHGAGERGEDPDIGCRHGYMKHVREEGAEYLGRSLLARNSQQNLGKRP